MLELINQCHKIVAVGADLLSEQLIAQISDDAQIWLAAPGFRQQLAHQHITHYDQWISDHDSEGTQYQFNLSHVKTLRPANQILTLYPGLKAEQMSSVTVTSASNFIGKLILNNEDNICLVVDLLGEEHAILNDLINGQKLNLFNFIILVGYDIELFDGTLPYNGLITLLEQNGFDSLYSQADKGSDLGKNITLLKQNLLAPKLVQLHEALAVSQQERAQLRQNLETQYDHHKVLKEASEQQLKSLEAQQIQLQQVKNELTSAIKQNEVLEQEISRLNQQIKNNEPLIDESQALKKQLAGIQDRNHQLTTENQTQKEQLAQLEKLQQEHQNLQKQLTDMQDRNQQLTTENHAQKDQLAQLEKLQQEHQNLQKQLVDMQDRHQQLTTENQAQKDQLAQLETLQQEHQVLQKQLTDIQDQKHQLTTENQTQKDQLAQLEKLQQEHQNLQKQLAEKQSYISTLENNKQELEYRQSQLDNEFMKVEAQLELIKEVVLREKAF